MLRVSPDLGPDFVFEPHVYGTCRQVEICLYRFSIPSILMGNEKLIFDGENVLVPLPPSPQLIGAETK